MSTSAGTASMAPNENAKRTSGWTRALAATTGALIGYLSVLGIGYSSIRFGDDLPWLAPQGALGTAFGYALLTLPLLGLAQGLALAPRLPRSVWLGALIASAVAVVLLTPPPAVDCGNNLTGYTCATGGTDPFRSSSPDVGRLTALSLRGASFST